jgi:hypothetical protein
VTLRINMPIFCRKEDSDEALRRLGMAVAEIRPSAVYLHMARRALRYLVRAVWRRISPVSVG